MIDVRAVVFHDDAVEIQFVSDDPPRDFEGAPVLQPANSVVIPLEHPRFAEAIEELKGDAEDLAETVRQRWPSLPLWEPEPDSEDGIALA